MIRGSKDLSQWNRIIKRKADESGSSSAAAGMELVKWGKIQKRDNEDIEDEEDEELEENEEEYDDEGENYEEELANKECWH